MSETTPVEIQVSVRIDPLPWSRWHTLIVSSLGVAWILAGVEVMIVANISSVLTNLASGLGLSSSQVGYAAAIYSAGAALGGCFSLTVSIGTVARSSSSSRSPSTCSSRS